MRELRFDRDDDCELCGARPAIGGIVPRAYEGIEVESGVAEIEADRLDEALRDATLLDVREPHEAVLGSIAGARSIPASQLDERMSELDSAIRYVVACRVGVKSLWAVRRLREAGFERLLHLRGGLLAYAARQEDVRVFLGEA